MHHFKSIGEFKLKLQKVTETLKIGNLPKIHKKIHKNTLPPPGRPIVSAMGSPTEKISAFIDHFLQTLLPCIPSFIKDTTYFLQILDNLPAIPEQALLATLDVSSLSTKSPCQKPRQQSKRFSQNLALLMKCPEFHHWCRFWTCFF